MVTTPGTPAEEPASSKRDYLRELANPAALSLAVTLIYLPFGLLGPAFIDPKRLGGSVIVWVLIGLCGQLALTAVILGGAQLIKRVVQIKARAALTFAIFLVATSTRGVTLAFIAFALGLTDTPEMRYRFVSAAFPQTLTLVVIALALTHFQGNLELVRSLRAERLRLANLQSSMLARVSAYRDNLTTEIIETIDPLLIRFRRLLLDVQAGVNRKSLDQMAVAIDSTVRPLNAYLGLAVKPINLRKPEVPQSRSLQFAFPSRLSLQVALSPLVSGLLILLSAISQSSRGLSPTEGWIFVLVTGFGMTLLVGLFRLACGRLRPAFAVSVFAAALINAASAFLAVSLQPVVGLPVPSFLTGPAIGIGLLIGLFTSVYQGMNQRQLEVEGLLRSVNNTYRANLSLLRQQLWVVRRNLSYLVHGSLQGTLRALILKIQNGLITSDLILPEIESEISRAVALLNQDNAKPPLVQRLFDDLATTWHGVIEIEIQLSKSAEALLNRVDSCRWCVNEIALEAIHNAAFHGGAKQALINVTIEDNEVVVLISDNGTGLSAEAKPGTGSHMLDQICVEWNRWQDGDKTHLQATLSVEDALGCRSDRPIAAKEA